MPCRRHVSPRNPIRFETTVDTPPPAAISPHATTSQAGPNPDRHHVRVQRRRHPHQQPVALPDAFAAGQRLVHHSAAAVPQASVGSGSNHSPAPSTSPAPFTSCWAHCRDTGSDSDVPDLLASHQEGVTHTTPSATHPVHPGELAEDGTRDEVEDEPLGKP
jgi:hypothetical protein